MSFFGGPVRIMTDQSGKPIAFLGESNTPVYFITFSSDASGNLSIVWPTPTGQLSTTLPSKPGCLWLNGGMLAIS